MKINMGNADRIIRFIIAAIIVTLYYSSVLSGTLGLVLIIFAGILVLTSLAGFCPLYILFGFNSCPAKK